MGESAKTSVLKQETDIHNIVTAPPTVQNTQNIHFLAADNEVSEEIVTHGDEVTMATSALEKEQVAEISNENQIAVHGIHYSEEFTEEANSQPSHSIESTRLFVEEETRHISEPVALSEDSIQ
jgi:hypothetical protein